MGDNGEGRHEHEQDAAEQLELVGADGKPMLDLMQRQRAVAVPAKGYGNAKKRLTANQEEFCQQYVFGGPDVAGKSSRAYEKAFGRPDRPSASRMFARDYIQERIAELNEQMRRESGITRENWLDWVRTNAQKASADGSWTGVNKALELIGKHMGFLDDKVDLAITDNRTQDQKLVDVAKKLADPRVMQLMVQKHPELEQQMRKVVAAVVTDRRPREPAEDDE